MNYLFQPWALTGPALCAVDAIADRLVSGNPLGLLARAGSPQRAAKPQRVGGNRIAVIPIHGLLLPHADAVGAMLGATSSYAELNEQLQDAVADSTVRTILLDVFSPGGSATGATELAQQILAARERKRIVACAHFEAGSSAYWLAACATEVVASPSALVGSIGIYARHDSLTKALEMAGIKRTYISAGEGKVDGNEAEPLSDRARANIQKAVNTAYAMFVGDVAKGRQVPVSDVRGGFGEGGMVFAREALRLGMIDRIECIDDTLRRVSVAGQQTSARAEAIAALNDAWAARMRHALDSSLTL